MNNTGLVSGNAQNNVTDKAVRTRSKFNMSYNHLQTARFGELNSHFVMEVVPSDVINLRSAHELRTYTLKAPLMQDIEIKKDYFSVPMEAILPLNWEKIYTNPTIGDDIDASQYGTSYLGFYAKYATFLKKLYNNFLDTNNVAEVRLECLLRFLTLGDLIYSSGSLMHQLGYHISGLKTPHKTDLGMSWDDFADLCYSTIENYSTGQAIAFCSPNNNTIFLLADNDSLVDNLKVSSRWAFDYLHQNSDWHVESGYADYSSLVSDLADFCSATYDITSFGTDIPVNLARVFAYQLVCAHYYSNDAVDYIYSADLFRQYIYSLVDEFLSNIAVRDWYHRLNFTYNGVPCNVDYLCSAVFTEVEYQFTNTSGLNVVSNNALPFYQYIQVLFGFKNSLRYLDYFTGSKTRPLAVGNVDANVVGGKVSIIDVTRNIQIQKFLNSVNRTGRKFSNYIEGLFGNKVAYDYHNPAYIAHTSDKAVAFEVENTGSDQLTKSQSVTAIARSNASKFAFEFHCDRPSILIGIFYFDIARNYSSSFEKPLFHVDRFDMFNPYLQFIGDQEVARRELDITLPSQPFGYQLRYAEYKQRVNTMEGGFVQYLPGFAFNASEKDFQSVGGAVVRPSFIRSHPWELDEFYVSLAYYCLAGYFHFIIKNNNNVEASRPMAFAPSIL